jgi:predicted Zn-dependent peptidase
MRRENLIHDEELIGYLRRCNTSLQKNLSVRVVDRCIDRASCASRRTRRASATLLALMSISIIHLACGMPLIVERMAHLQSAALTFSCPAGSATEPAHHDGRSAILEEILLRGMGAMRSRDAADAFDRLGASRDVGATALNIRVSCTCLASNLGPVLALVSSMVREPRMDAESVDACRELALQALDSLKDDPQERASMLLRERHLAMPIGRSGMGTPEGLAACTRDVLLQGWLDRARPVGSVLAIAGNVDAVAIASQMDRLLAGWHGAAAPIDVTSLPPRGYAHEVDETGSQVQILVGCDAPPEGHADSAKEKLALSVLSGGMSGRLFTEVREKRGLCYSVSASYRGEREFGSVQAYVGTTPQRAQEALDVLLHELQRINTPEGRVTQEEFERARVGVKAALVFAGESAAARAASLVSDWHRLHRPRSLQEIGEQIEQVTLDDLNAYLLRRTLGEKTVQTLGPAALTV